MSESPSPHSPGSVAQDGGAAARGSTPLTPERIDEALNRFRSWLTAHLGQEPPPPSEEPRPPEIDVDSVLRQFIGLRQEVNLQTRAVRSVLEQNAQLLEEINQPSAGGQANPADIVRPMLKGLLDVHDMLALTVDRIERLRADSLPTLEQLGEPIELPPMPPPPHSGLISRLLGRAKEEAQRWQQWVDDVRRRHEQRAEAIAATIPFIHQSLDSLVTGYQMGRSRLEKVFAEFDVEPIDCLGKSFDPEQMEILELVESEDAEDNQVVDEVRRGYHWKGTVLRYAQVRVAR